MANKISKERSFVDRGKNKFLYIEVENDEAYHGNEDHMHTYIFCENTIEFIITEFNKNREEAKQHIFSMLKNWRRRYELKKYVDGSENKIVGVRITEVGYTSDETIFNINELQAFIAELKMKYKGKTVWESAKILWNL